MEIGGKLRFSHKVKSTSFGISLSLIASKVTKKYGYPIFISLIMLPFQIFFFNFAVDFCLSGSFQKTLWVKTKHSLLFRV